MSRDRELPRNVLYSFRAWGRRHSPIFCPIPTRPRGNRRNDGSLGQVGLKYSIHYYSIMGRPTGQETDAIEKIWCLIVPKRRGHATPQRAPLGQHHGGQEAGGRGNGDKILYYSFCREERGRQGEQAYDCLV